MNVVDFEAAVSYQATGKVNAFTSGSVKWLKILALANTNITDWQNEPDVDWNSLLTEDEVIGTVTATNSYTLPTTVRYVSSQEGDVVRIIHTDGVTFTDYDLVDANRMKDFANYQRTYQDNFITDINGAITFNRAFNATDPQFGGMITAPCYGFATQLVLDTDVVPVDIPNWLVYATAADYDATDVTRQQLVPRLEARANQVMDRMKADNDGQNTDMYRPWRPGGANLMSTGLQDDI